jgi:molecular chaperone DnaK
MSSSTRDEKRSTEVQLTTRTGGPGTATRGLAIGIDLGTSTTCAAFVTHGRAQVIPTRYGTNTIPSVVALGTGGKVLVGEAAAKRLVLNPRRTVYGSKRLIGRTYSQDLAEQYQPHYAYPIVETEGHRFGAALEGYVMPMEEVATHLLTEVRAIAETHLGSRVTRAVITVPAYFSEVQREFVREAGKSAGLDVARVVNEPTAAAVAYGFRRSQEARLAVFDLGGGTFDVSILDVSAKRFQVVGTGGDDFLGGFDFDERIATHLLEQFKQRERIQFDPTPQQLARLRETAEHAKRSLSVQSRIQVAVPQFVEVGGKLRDLSLTFSREELESCCADLLEKTMSITAAVLDSAKVDPHSVDEILLVGGSTRMPTVHDRVAAFFGKKPSRGINPDEAVSVGAALLAAEPEDTDVRLLDVLPLSIGIAGQGRRFRRMLPRNSPVPAERAFVVSTSKTDQREYRQHLFQGERADAVRNEYLGTVIIEEIPPGPPNRQNVELALALDEQGRLTVRATELSSKEALPVRLDRAGSVQQIAAELGPYADETASAQTAASAPQRGLFGWLHGLFARR